MHLSQWAMANVLPHEMAASLKHFIDFPLQPWWLGIVAQAWQLPLTRGDTSPLQIFAWQHHLFWIQNKGDARKMMLLNILAINIEDVCQHASRVGLECNTCTSALSLTQGEPQ